MDRNLELFEKSDIWNYFIENIISGIQLLYINPHVPTNIIKVFFDFRFSRRKSQSQQKLSIKITYFAIQVCSKHLIHFTNLKSLDIENNMLPKHCQKSFWLYKFFRKHVSVWCQHGGIKEKDTQQPCKNNRVSAICFFN